MCNMAHNKSFGFISTAFNELHRHIVFIIENTNILFKDGYTINCV